jgi:hypothetical protein
VVTTGLLPQPACIGSTRIGCIHNQSHRSRTVSLRFPPRNCLICTGWAVGKEWHASVPCAKTVRELFGLQRAVKLYRLVQAAGRWTPQLIDLATPGKAANTSRVQELHEDLPKEVSRA